MGNPRSLDERRPGALMADKESAPGPAAIFQPSPEQGLLSQFDCERRRRASRRGPDSATAVCRHGRDVVLLLFGGRQPGRQDQPVGRAGPDAQGVCVWG